jgi:plasmid stabilization system protein ParE
VTFDVVWLPAAEQELAAVWTASSRRNDVARAVAAIDRLLELDPPNAGESRAGGRRILIEPPLGVIFRVVGPTVLVSRVWEYS